MIIPVAIAAAVGLAVGLMIGLLVFRRTQVARVEHDTSSAALPESDLAGSLREGVELLEIGVVVADSSGLVRYRNPAAELFRGTHVGVLVDEQVTTGVNEARTGVAATRLVEMHGPPKIWLEFSVHPMSSGGAVVTMRDVSERHRTDAIRTDFVTNISHELKTPVGAVAVLAEALMDESDPTVVQRLADHLVEEAHRAARTIDELLKLSEIESTHRADDIVDVASVVQLAIGRGRAADVGRNVEITALDLPDDLFVRGDERQLVSAVGNLVENAVKYSRPGGLVQLRARADDTSVEVMVADQGIGIPRRDLDRVFERFYRVDRARSRVGGGTGLGLAIVRHVADNHGGDVVVSSQEGEGSTFVLRLPASIMVDRHGEPRTDRTEAREVGS